MYKFLIPALAAVVLTTAVSCEGAKSAKNIKLETASDSLSYAIGINIGESFKGQDLTEVDADIMAAVINAILIDDTAGLKMTSESSVTFIQTYMQKKDEMEAAKAVEEGKKFLEENAKKPGVQVTATGVQYLVLQSGNGISPTDNDQVTVHYTGKLVDGEVFDSSIEGGQPATFNLNQVVAGWSEALKLMKEGDKWMVYIPSEQGFGPQGYPGVIPPNATLIFEIELIKVNKVAGDDQP